MIRELSEAVVTEGCLEKCKGQMKEMHEKLKLLIMKLIVGWHGTRGGRGCARNVTVGKLRMCTIGYCSALHGITSDSLFWKPWMK